MIDVPDHVPDHLVEDFDLVDDPALATDPFAALERLRDCERRLLWLRVGLGHGDGVRHGAWLLTTHEDIRQVLQDPQTFSSRPPELDPETRDVGTIPIFLDPPDHGLYRRALAPYFSPGAVAKFDGQLRDAAERLAIAVPAQREVDFIEAFARPLPTEAFVGWMGLAPSDALRFVELHHLRTRGGVRDRVAARDELIARLDRAIYEHRQEPRDDLLTSILSTEVDGAPLSDADALSVIALLFSAGLDTVTQALSFGFLYLATHPDLRRRVASDVECHKAVVEEILRAHSFANLMRFVTEDVEIAGVTLRRGDRIITPLTLAGRDPSVYQDGANVDPDRPSSAHLAFGAGPHRCLGSHLARRELAISLEVWHRGVPDYELASPAETFGGIVMGVSELRLRILR